MEGARGRSMGSRMTRLRAPESRPRTITARELRENRKGSYAAHEALQVAVLNLLRLRRMPAVPVHTGPRVTPIGGGAFRLRSNAAQHGLSDVLTCLRPSGRLVLIECKTGNARRSPEQVRLQADFSAAGALCLVVRDVLELARKLHEFEHAAPRAP